MWSQFLLTMDKCLKKDNLKLTMVRTQWNIKLPVGHGFTDNVQNNG